MQIADVFTLVDRLFVAELDENTVPELRRVKDILEITAGDIVVAVSATAKACRIYADVHDITYNNEEREIAFYPQKISWSFYRVYMNGEPKRESEPASRIMISNEEMSTPGAMLYRIPNSSANLYKADLCPLV